jgi:uncharacterized protein YndB with AHSA1/START domain
MSTSTKQTLTIKATVNAPVSKVWDIWTSPEHITQWNTASEDWHTPTAQNDLRKGGKFSSRMEAKDGSFGFDFEGVYDEVKEHELIQYTMADGRQVTNQFIDKGNVTEIVSEFEPETENSLEMQQAGWQAILDNFRKYTETAVNQ